MVVSHTSEGFTGSSDGRSCGVIRGYIELIDTGGKVHDGIIAEVTAEDNVVNIVRTGTEQDVYKRQFRMRKIYCFTAYFTFL